MEIAKGLIGNSYYDNSAYINTYLSTILSLYDYFENFLFPDDPSRIIYAGNDFAFRQRLRTNKSADVSKFQIQSLNMPFMNFSISPSGISQNTDRKLRNNPLEVFGVMDWNIHKKIKLSPLQLSLEATFYSNEEKDIQYVMSELQWDDALETIVKPELEIDGQLFHNFMSLGYSNLAYNPSYQENDWLEKNNIRTIALDMTLDTFLIKVNSDNSYWIPKEVLVSFAIKHNLTDIDWTSYDKLITGVIDHINQTVEVS